MQIPLVQGVLVAEVVEVFEAAQNLGWDCSKSNGEGLSRTLAEELHPLIDQYFYTADVWLDSARNDYVDTTFPSDVDPASIGCAVLFLNYLQFLGYSWAEIAQAGAPTLAGVYQNLTSLASAYSDFRAVIDAFFPWGSFRCSHGSPLTCGPEIDRRCVDVNTRLRLRLRARYSCQCWPN